MRPDMNLRSYIVALHAALFGILIACSPAGSGSMLLMGAGKARSGCADANVVAWRNAVIAASGTVSPAQEGYVCTLVGSLKSHSLFSVQDRIWLHASENTQQATIDLVSAAVATPVSAPTFAASQGYTFSGANYIDTGYAPFTNGTNFLRDSSSISTYVRTSRTSTNNGTAIGMFDAGGNGNQGIILPLGGSSLLSYDVNNSQFTAQVTNSPANAQGFYTATRTGASVQAVYKNSNSTALATNTTASIALPNVSPPTFYIGARNQNGTANLFSTDQIAVTVLGGGLTGANAAQLQTDINAYMTSLGTNVY